MQIALLGVNYEVTFAESSAFIQKCYSAFMSTSNSKTNLESNSVGVRELRQNASVLLRRVKAGEIIEITEHGTPIAKLVAVDPSKYGEYLEKKLETLIIPAKEPLSNLKLRDILDLPGRPLSEILQENRTAEKY